MIGIKDWREYENPLATSETVARAENVMAKYAIADLDLTRKQKPRDPKVIRAIIRDMRAANGGDEQ